MHLERPLVFLDLEATGLDTSRDRIIEIACVRVEPDRRRETFERFVQPGERLRPEIVDLTGITDDMLTGAPTFRELVEPIAALLHDADLAGYNASQFDVPLLEAEFRRAGFTLPGPVDRVVIDPLEILKKHEVRTLAWAYRFYFGDAPPASHRALQDTEITMEILRAQIRRYGLEGTPQSLLATLRHPYLDSRHRLLRANGQIIVNFGKHKGKAVSYLRKVDPDYIRWMCENLGPEISGILQENGYA